MKIAYILIIASLTLGIRTLFLYMYNRTIDGIFSVRIIKTPKFIYIFKNTFLALASIVFCMMIFDSFGKPNSFEIIDLNTTLITIIVLFGITPKIFWMFYLGFLLEYRKIRRELI